VFTAIHLVLVNQLRFVLRQTVSAAAALTVRLTVAMTVVPVAMTVLAAVTVVPKQMSLRAYPKNQLRCKLT
jgi:hypothetical protein